MQVRPEDLGDELVAAVLRDHWAIEVREIVYAPLGFGSHHWVVDAVDGRRWFVSVDLVDAPEDDASALVRLEAALQSAFTVREAGLAFVVAPVRSRDSSIVHRVGQRYAAAVYPFIDGDAALFRDLDVGGSAIRSSVVDLLVALHGATQLVTGVAGRETFAIEHRGELEQALTELAQPWEGGPFAEPARELLAPAARELHHVLHRHDELAEGLLAEASQWVLTHGEPKVANLMVGPDGALLIDWDTALIGPAARDLWMVDSGTGEELKRYEQSTGRSVSEAGLELYRTRWVLMDIAGFVAGFRLRHDRDADTELGWAALQGYLEPLAAGRMPEPSTG